MEINWLDAIATVLDTTSELFAMTRGTGMDNDLVPLAAILLFTGGILFWFFLTVMVLVGAFRLVMKGMWAVVDLVPAKHRDGGSLPHVE